MPTGEEDVVADLVRANRILANEGVLDAFGHISARDPARPDTFLLSRALSPGQVQRADIMRFDLEGNVLEGDAKPYLERVIHAAVYAIRPDVGSVVHHHAPAVLPFTVAPAPLRPVIHLGAVAGGDCPVWDSQDEFGDTSLLVDSLAMAASLARALGDRPSCLLARHGALCVGPSIRQTTFIAVCMRDNAEVLSAALRLGRPSYLSDGEIVQAAARHDGGAPVERAWSFWSSRAA
ncbi:class II aldolase/adducin family protein [Polymorphum gilvum]|uniref:Possible ribulose-5-phosphate 4-epimerase-like epimerase n=1 Tax=Polymorphum gilvum (strain LMG 25793 / CGMCC 1.9160 / SL003B-26A1) TaxID=991905 RepID=F2IZJ4_POLGS|nr:class II aldolase/adducin family protein [Polymorphum gilvum]ADZ69551.1 Possible ribulose-5-phosphate 4-epimerase-like epimerase [Polymorphum gilvum SL003B-26A1]